MHLLVRERTSLDEAAPACDLGLPPADVIMLSFSDSDLAAWNDVPAEGVRVHAVPLARLLHPMSIDLFIEDTVAGSGCVVVRLLGGVEYWRYGAEELAAFCRRHGVALAMVAGDRADDERLAALSTIDPSQLARLDAMLRQGGPANTRAALRLALAAAGRMADDGAVAGELPPCGECDIGIAVEPQAGRAALVVYRSHLLAGDLAPQAALARALAGRGIATRAFYVDSPRSPASAAYLAHHLRACAPDVVLNVTGFAARDADGHSPLEIGVPVLQMVVAGNDEAGWAASPRGLSPQDLAMQVVLPELDGRILAGAIGCKTETNGVRRSIPLAAAIDVAADRAAGWIRLARTPPAERRIAIVLSDYPGVSGATHSVGHAVGLDGPASLAAILGWLHVAGYDTPAPPDPDTLTRLLLASRRRVLRFGRITVAVQPDRGGAYHDPAAEPCRAYVAFHRWLARLDAVVHLGTHGTLEWLPGKAVALSAACWPARLMRKPVIYPFIVNNPGEAAVAKRRLGAVTIGHLTPPLIRAELSGEARAIERLIDEYAECEAMDRRRAALLADEIVERAASSGLMAEAGTGTGTGDDVGALAAYLCDVKELRIADGLHVYGRPPAGRAALLEAVGETHAAALDASAGGERASLLAALDGRFVEPGPAGAPSRGRSDVLPTGRNLTGIDPRMVPTPSATRLAARTATCLLARHLQDTGEDLERLVLDLWGSASLRTGGEDLALAFVLMGCVPVHCDATGRMTGVDILPPALLDRPRVDVTLRVSGLFRDAFAGQIAMFDQAVARLSGGPRVFGPSPGTFGISDDWLAGSAFAYGAGVEGAPSPDQLARLVSDAQALVHQQDHHETDILDGPEHAAHEGGFARAARALGASPALYHLDITGEARVRTVAEEIRRVTRGRLANPVWLAAMRRHGYRGASEMARGVEALADFARALPCRFDAQFDLAADAILADAANARFLAEANEAAHAAIRDTLSAMTEAGLWHPRRNDPDALR